MASMFRRFLRAVCSFISLKSNVYAKHRAMVFDDTLILQPVEMVIKHTPRMLNHMQHQLPGD